MSKHLFSDQLRYAIQKSGVTRYRISQETGISQANLSRFVNGTAGLSLASIDAICELIDAKLVAAEPKPIGKAPVNRKRRTK